MSTFAQTDEHDLAVVNGQLVLTRDEAECAAIELRNKFGFVLGEYFLDRRQGVPYFSLVFVMNPQVLLIRQLFRSIILSVQTISKVLELRVDFDRRARKLFFKFRAQATNGKVVIGGSGQPFIVEPS